MNYACLLLAVMALPIAIVACASAREEEAPVPPEYVIPAEARLEPAEYLDELATGEGEEGELLIGGEPEFPSKVYGRKLLRAPVTGQDCLYYWLEIAYETEKVHYHLLTDIGENEIYVRLGEAYVEVDHPRGSEGRPADVVRTYQAGEEPAD
ncbi:MAG: hypothetical protein JSU81_03510, partial [Candidatus Coatesbacteria bacterium]